MPCCCSCVETGSVGVVQRFGEYQGVQQPGCAFICWPCTTSKAVSLAVNQFACKSVCKTKDNVTVTVITAVQHRILREMVKTAVFEVKNPRAQATAEVESMLRSTVPMLTLDELHEAKEALVTDILNSLRRAMGQYGYEVLSVLIRDVQPEEKVKQAMNDINASRRRREVAFEQGEADKMLKIKASEADAEGKRLAGVGMANMRAAMAQGYQDSVALMKESGLSTKQAMHMMITTQYLDTLKEFSSSHGSIIVPHCPSAIQDLKSQVSQGMLAAAPQQQMEDGEEHHCTPFEKPVTPAAGPVTVEDL
ncbi:unnamed protein product [Effrenium voratum]|nr:unnamed protein product [Effrenium voratum]